MNIKTVLLILAAIAATGVTLAIVGGLHPFAYIIPGVSCILFTLCYFNERRAEKRDEEEFDGLMGTSNPITTGTEF